MNEYGWLIAGLTAASGMIAMFWSYIRSIWSQLSSQVIVNVQIDGRLAFAVNLRDSCGLFLFLNTKFLKGPVHFPFNHLLVFRTAIVP